MIAERFCEYVGDQHLAFASTIARLLVYMAPVSNRGFEPHLEGLCGSAVDSPLLVLGVLITPIYWYMYMDRYKDR